MKKNISLLLLTLFCLQAYAQEVTLETFATGFSGPVDIQNAGDERLFVVEQRGVIKILNLDGTTNSTPFLDIQPIVNNGGERGLLGLAFHPDYSTNGYFFVHYSDGSGDTQISRFSVDGTNPDIADPNSEFDILNVFQPASNHNGGTITFGPDGYLYIGLGDGGGSGDTDNNAQNTTLLIGKMLRIDIDTPAGGNNYSIPPDNPFVGNSTVEDEIWAIGLRNPFRFSIDDENNTIWIGDVGQNAREEINKASLSEGGLNYGWRCYEGNSPFNTTNCPNPSELTFPVLDYPWNGGGSAIGGYVYHGSIYQDLQNVYIFADIDGMIGTIDSDDNYINQGTFSGTWVGFGEDINEEIYVVNLGGSIHKVIGGVILNTSDASELALSIVPNPAQEIITVQLENDEHITAIQIFDITGKTIVSEKDIQNNRKRMNVQSLSKGIYILKIDTKDASITKKLLIE